MKLFKIVFTNNITKLRNTKYIEGTSEETPIKSIAKVGKIHLVQEIDNDGKVIRTCYRDESSYEPTRRPSRRSN
jgi:hypothetical protein